MINEDLMTILNADSIIIDSGSKAGKMTFLCFLINFLYKEHAIVFTPQESYLFQRRIDALSSCYDQFSNLKTHIVPYYLNQDWTLLKQKYGFDFFLQELTQIMKTSPQKIVVMHRFGEYFEFQDRYEIEKIYKALIKSAKMHDKKIVFLVNNQSENYEFIRFVADEFSDVSINVSSNEEHERIVSIKNMLHNKEFPLMHFRIHEENFILDLYEKNQELLEKKKKNILIAELDRTHDSIHDICYYIFEKPKYSVKYADTLQGILQEIFVSPDIIIVLMQRKKENLETIAAIKKQLPNTFIVSLIDQDFVRSEDMQEAYNYGCDELFANNFSLETFILSLQKASKTFFYTEGIKTLPKHKSILNSLEEYHMLAKECLERYLFFTAFVMETQEKVQPIYSTSRHSDYIFYTEHKIYYFAINTMPKDIRHIIKGFEKKYSDLSLVSIWEPINHEAFEKCIR